LQDRSTDFEFLPIDVSLGRCQRYFWKGTINGSGVFGGSGGSIPIISWSFPTTMRTTPTFAWVSGGSTGNGNNSYTITGITTYSASVNSARILWSQTGTTGSNTQGAQTTDAISTFDSEL